MPPVTLAAVVDLTKIKMKWHEQYVSEGLNRKVIPGSPKGIYSGLRLVQNISAPRQVEISAGADSAHAAVHQSSVGYSTTYYDNAGTSIILDLSAAGLTSQTVVITLSIVYIIGGDTTANWIAYTLADWNALTDAQRGERIVLGTVNVPAVATNITTVMILADRRTLAWENAASGAAPWAALLKNGGFEYALDNGTYRNAVPYWVATQHANGEWKVQSVDAKTGTRALSFDQLSAGATNAVIEQAVGVPAAPGQLIRYQINIKNLKVSSGGTLLAVFDFADNAYTGSVSVSVPIAMTVVDASYRVIDGMIIVPANAAHLYALRIENTLTQGSTGIAFRIDDVQAWLEVGAIRGAPGAGDRVRQMVNTQGLTIENGANPTAGYFDSAAVLSMPVADQVKLERRDQNVTTANPIKLDLGTVQLDQIGAGLLNTEARALLARFIVPVAVGAGVNFTLLWESVPSGLKGLRIYAGDLFAGAIAEPGFLLTVNARFTGTTWVRDVNGNGSSAMYLDADQGRTGVITSDVTPCLTTFVRQSTLANTWNSNEWQESVALSGWNDVAGGGYLQTSTLGLNGAALDATKPMVIANHNPLQRGAIMRVGITDPDSYGTGMIDPHGSYVYDRQYFEEDFNQNGLGSQIISQNLAGAGTVVTNGNGVALITTGGTISDVTLIKFNSTAGVWSSNIGSSNLGFRARVRASDITGSTQRMGMFAPLAGDPDLDVSMAAAFKIVDGVVSVVHNGGTVVATGITVNTTASRWYSLNFDPISGLLQWHISSPGGSLQDGYATDAGAAYGEIASTADAGGFPTTPFFAVKSTTFGTAGGEIDYISAWGSRSA